MLDTSAAPAPLFACPDWWEKIQAGETPMPDIPLNKEKAAKALAFFNRLRLPDVPGNPPLSEACGQWFKDILVAFLASEDPETREILVWELLCMVPKKNSKSTYVAALALTALYMTDLPNSTMLLIGPSQNISNRLFGQAQGMIRLDPKLQKIFDVKDHLKIITRVSTGTSLEVKTFATSIVTGEIPILTIVDELHELGKKASAMQVMQQVRGGGITQKGGQVLFITTQSDQAPSGIWASELRKARQIRDGKAGDHPIMLPVLYEFPEDLQRKEEYWRDQKNWAQLLPNLGLSIDGRKLVADYENNGKASKETEQIWMSQHLNVQIGLAMHDERWIGADYWKDTARPLSLEDILANSDVVTIGIDGGGLDDLLAIGLIGRHAETRVWQSWGRAWAKPAVFKQRKDLRPLVAEAIEAGDLVECSNDDPGQDLRELVAICAKVANLGLLPEAFGIGVDRIGVPTIVDDLEAAQLDGELLTSVPQGTALQPATKGLPVKMDNGSFVHADQPLLDWCVSNAKMEARGTAEMMVKHVAGTAKIDPVMALLNAAILMTRNPTAAGLQTSPFDDPNFSLADYGRS